MVREAMTLMLGLEPDFSVVGSVSSVEAAQQLLLHEPVDVLILDLLLGDVQSHTFINGFRALQPQLRILLITGSQLPALLQACISFGVNGLLAKNASSSELCTAIRKLLAGDNYFCADLLKLVNELSSWNELTPREQDVLRLIAQGANANSIATSLNISHATARKHRENLMRKLNVHNTAELVHFAHQQGLQ